LLGREGNNNGRLGEKERKDRGWVGGWRRGQDRNEGGRRR